MNRRDFLKHRVVVPVGLWFIAGASSSGGRLDVEPQTLTVTILGSGAGPAVNLQRFGPSILVEAGDHRLLFDCGRGAMLRLKELDIPFHRLDKLFLTHLHSDHIIDIPDLLLTPWIAGRRTPLEVWGPAGTRDMMNHLQAAFAFDIHMRRDIDEKYPGEGVTVSSHDIEEGTVFERHGVKVTAFLVDHGPVEPAFGYRIDYGNHSVALSGDTRPSQNLVRFARGVDVLIHEAIDPEEFRARRTKLTREQVERVIAHHSTPEEAGGIFAAVDPRLAVYAHAPTSDTVMARTRKVYGGRLEGGEDMMTIEIGEQIQVRRFRP